MSRKNIIPVFVPHYGCPCDCVFCNQNRITDLYTPVDENYVISTVEEYLNYFSNKDNIELAFYGGSFTAINIEIQKKLLKVAKKYKDLNIISSIRLSTRPDAIDEKILNMLKEFSVDTIELGVQSLDEEVLFESNRGHDAKCVYSSVDLIKNYDFNLGLQQMIGLPKDTILKSIYTANEFVGLSPNFVRIYPTLIIKDTQLESDYYSGIYKPLTLEETIIWTKELLKLYMKYNINVIRIGLQVTENINLDNDVVAGPFHESIRQLVESEIFYDVIIKALNGKKIENLKICGSGKSISNLSGQKGSIRNRIKENLNLKKISYDISKIDDDKLNLIYNDKSHFIKTGDYLD